MRSKESSKLCCHRCCYLYTESLDYFYFFFSFLSLLWQRKRPILICFTVSGFAFLTVPHFPEYKEIKCYLTSVQEPDSLVTHKCLKKKRVSWRPSGNHGACHTALGSGDRGEAGHATLPAPEHLRGLSRGALTLRRGGAAPRPRGRAVPASLRSHG